VKISPDSGPGAAAVGNEMRRQHEGIDLLENYEDEAARGLGIQRHSGYAIPDVLPAGTIQVSEI